MRALWLSTLLALGLGFQVGCDSSTPVEEPTADPVVSVEEGTPEAAKPEATPEPAAEASAPKMVIPEPSTPAPAAPETPAPKMVAPEPGEPAPKTPDASDAPALKLPPEDAAAGAPTAQVTAPAEPTPMTIGSVAPPLNIEYWVSKDFEPVTDFQKGNVYIVEFWATWCGPCVSSMPHLAETQKKYKDKGVRLISISDEDLDTVEKFLERKVPSSEDDGKEETFGQLTSAYSLTTDPDGSCQTDYMRASNQNGIPTAFIVGKTGQIEWIGHPMEMDEPLAKVVGDSWDRDAYLAEFKAKEQMTEIMMMARRGNADGAIKAIDAIDPKTLGESGALQLQQLKLGLYAQAADKGKEFSALANQMLDDVSDPNTINGVTWYIYQASQNTDVDKALIKKAIAASESSIKELDAEARPFMLDTIAHLHEQNGDIDSAIAAQTEAVETSEGRMKDRLTVFLNELKEKKEGGDKAPENKPADATPAE
ncbi:Thiol-disulfide oxidoreductase ResA [Roseimaritima multifibrata]|uniref:Thiol-disulfide oxidoreductase ResA n=1 Tax=Roseimaritima multifibrata TaxID=1930274 RepID=A0A517MF01_9BACT|nr:TlpA disulfide reductase family protein [Roseimaritima multifibrata]QDS93458.1 Thiol-disulfide oxidoreductase ResA [Roseimaritima multifibrata]